MVGHRSAPSIGPGVAPAAPSVRSGEAVPGETDLQTLLARTAMELAERTGAGRVVAWRAREGGRPAVWAASVEGAVLHEPTPEAWTQVATLRDATDLGGPDAPPGAAEVARAHGLSAAAPVRRRDGEVAAVLLLGADAEPPGAVRPRTLAILRAAAERLAGPASAALAAERLASLDAEARRLDRLAALGGLVAEIVHEIRNPLVSVKTFLQLLPERAEDPDFREGFLEVAAEELRRIERLVEAVLEHARPRRGRREEERAEVPAALDAVARLVAFRAADRGVTLDVETEDAVPPAHLGEDALRQIVLNLVLNALDATVQGGRVRLRARAEGDRVAILVDDGGPGIPEPVRERIFEPFFSTREGHAGGLGLAITRRIVEEAGGRVTADDAPGGGSRFRVELPAARP
jgi:signal transduction histidine kinase